MGIAFVDLEFRFQLINDTLAAIHGQPAAAFLGRRLEDAVPALWSQLKPMFERVRDSGHAVTDVDVSGEVASTPGFIRHFLGGFYPVHDQHGALIGIGVMVVEVTELKQAEVNHRAVLAAMPDFIFDLDRDGIHLSFHAPQEAALFVSPNRIIGRPVDDLLPAAVAAQYHQAIDRTLAAGAMQVFEYHLNYPDGDRTFDARMVPKGPDEVLVVVRDITERHRAEQVRLTLQEQLRQAQKMEAIGLLAGGIAHDFNNLLTIINGYSDMLLNAVPEGDALRGPAAEIRNAGERARTLTRQLLMFSRQQVLEPKVIDLNEIVTAAETMLRRLIEADVRLVTVLQPRLQCVKADAGQVEQTLINLCVNARDAMPGGGTLRIETRDVTLTEPDTEIMPAMPPGDFVLLAVSDTGSGIEAATKERLFEPFFTTKGPGKGTGLGLAVVFGVVKQSGGHVKVTTEVGRGTTFSLYFPRAETTIATPPASLPAAAAPRRGYETIFLVEDDNAVRSLVKVSLERSGYRVVEASDGEEAIRFLQTYQGPLDLLVSDVVMPNLGGRQLAEQVQAMRPTVKVLFLSGYTDDAVLKHGINHAEFNFLQKPFSPAALANTVRRILDEPGP
jgi:two-component system cell cycle sensor histidine kinase/response regulator CckA